MGQAHYHPVQHHYAKRTVTIADMEREDFLNTGDLILFRGSDLSSLIIRCGSWCRYSHIGMIDRFRMDKTSVVAVFESVAHKDKCTCILSRQCRSGVRLVTLRDRLQSYIDASYNGTVSVCIVRLDLLDTLDERIQQRAVDIAQHLMHVEQELCPRPYEHNVMVPARSQYSWILGENPTIDTQYFFCSELVAYAYQKMGLFDAEFPAASCSHKPFCNGYDFPFINARLNTEIWHYQVRSDGGISASEAAAAAAASSNDDR